MTEEVRAHLMYEAGWNEKTKGFSKKLAMQRFKESMKEDIERLFLKQRIKEKWSSNYLESIKLR